jgi:hypothetical protein
MRSLTTTTRTDLGAELRQIHADLNKVGHMVISETLDGIEPVHSSTNPWNPEYHHSFYTDGSPVTTTALDYDDPMPSVHLHFCEREITPLAGFIGENGHLDKPLTAGNVNLALPPHDRPCGCSDGGHCEAAVSVGDGMGVSV